ncbi:MAG: glycosyltransferase family 4 protein [Candidatus Aenigmarchaeota archaeon]|nr:glycosyltransferase family 4 protein [Candidatus Aenigmarchaeota archaeon]
MKILIIAPNISKPYLGPSAVVYNKLKGFKKIENELEKNDVNITFLSLNDEPIRKNLTKKIEVIGSKRYPPITFTGELQALLRRVKGFEVVHSHDLYELFPHLFKKISTVYTLHGIFWKEIKFKNGFYPKIWLKMGEFRLKLYYPKITKFVAVSQYVIEELKAKGFDTSKAVIIENPVSDEFFNVKKREEPLILYPATLRFLKNQLGFLKAVSMVKDELTEFKIVFAGSGDKEYETKLREFVERKGLNVEFLGRVPYDKMPELYSKASIVALTSLEETFGLAIAEAMASGTPVIASNVGGIPYVLKNGETGFIVNPENPKDIAEKLLILANDSNLRKKMSREARAEAEKRWKDEVIAKKHLDLYLSIY